MFKDILVQQKYEKEELIRKKYVTRSQLDIAKDTLEHDIIKVITGPRRAGKSTFAFLLLKNSEFAYANFDDERFLAVKNYDEILKSIFEVYPDTKIIFFDEIQNLENWELFVTRLHRRGYNLLLTGSNAHLLSKEMATFLTGRHIPIEILPFSFREYLADTNIEADIEERGIIPEAVGNILSMLEDYLEKRKKNIIPTFNISSIMK